MPDKDNEYQQWKDLRRLQPLKKNAKLNAVLAGYFPCYTQINMK